MIVWIREMAADGMRPKEIIKGCRWRQLMKSLLQLKGFGTVSLALSPCWICVSISLNFKASACILSLLKEKTIVLRGFLCNSSNEEMKPTTHFLRNSEFKVIHSDHWKKKAIAQFWYLQTWANASTAVYCQPLRFASILKRHVNILNYRIMM